MRKAIVSVVTLLCVCAWGLLAAQRDNACSVRVTLVDAVSGKPLPGLIRVRDSAGKSMPIEGLLPRGRGLPADSPIHEWYVVTEPMVVQLPRAELTLTAFSGLETGYAEHALDLRNRERADVTLSLPRIHDAHAAGRWNANTHVHLQKINRAQSDRYLVDVGMADGLDLVFVSYLERAEAEVEYITNKYTRADLHALNNHHVHFDHGEEHRHNFTGFEEGYGHVMLLAIPELVYPVSIGPGISKTGTDGIPLKRGIERARELGGTVIWCHNQWGLEDIPNWLAGRLHANNIFDGGSHGSYEHSFYRYLDCGIKVPFSTGTDWFIYDFARVYVPAQERPTPEAWLAQLAAGKSYITNGPLLEFSVEGQGIGADVALDQPGKVRVKGSAIGRVDFERIELLKNGAVIETRESRNAAGAYRADMEIDVDVSEPCWLALRTPPPSVPDNAAYSAKTPLNEYGQELFAHTSATFVDVGGKRRFDRAAAASLFEEMQRGREFIAGRGVFADDVEKRQVLEVYDQGIDDLRTRFGSSSE
jgi:hypothetical protein